MTTSLVGLFQCPSTLSVKNLFLIASLMNVLQQQCLCSIKILNSHVGHIWFRSCKGKALEDPSSHMTFSKDLKSDPINMLLNLEMKNINNFCYIV